MADTTVERPRADLEPPSRGGMVRYLVLSILINGILPFVLYRILIGQGVATVPALVAGSVFPIANTAWSWLKTRRLDLIGIISLIFILTSAAASLLSGSTRFTLLKESLFTGLFGLIFLGSLLTPRPLMFLIARQFSTHGDPERIATWDGNWQNPGFRGFRHTFRVMTAIWGVMFVADALIRVALVFVLSVSVFLVVSQVLFYGMFALTFSGTMAYGQRQRKAAALRQAQQANPPSDASPAVAAVEH